VEISKEGDEVTGKLIPFMSQSLGCIKRDGMTKYSKVNLYFSKFNLLLISAKYYFYWHL
jgi:hypothetical protein